MADYARHFAEIEAAGGSVIAASVDDEEHAKEVADEVSFPVAHGVTREQADQLGSWWEDRRSIIQPSEFMVSGEGGIMTSSYSSGPLGRIDPEDAVKMFNFLQSMKNK